MTEQLCEQCQQVNCQCRAVLLKENILEQPNTETINVIEKAERGEEVKEASDASELLKELNGPNTELLIVKTLQGLTTCINNELDKLVVLRGCMPINNMMVVIDQAIEVIASFEKNELYKLQKAFE